MLTPGVRGSCENFIKGKIVRFSEVGLKMRFRQFPALWLSYKPTPRMHGVDPSPESYKRGHFQHYPSVEIRQPKSEHLCIGLHGRAVSALPAGLYYSYSVEGRWPVDRHLLRIPAQAGIDTQLSTVDDRIADTLPALAANQFITTPTV